MSKKVQKIAIMLSLAIAVGGSLTFLMTWRNIGFVDHFIEAWLSSFALSVLCMGPLAGIIAFLINRFLNATFPKLSVTQLNIVFGLIMAVFMESIMAVVTTVHLHGFLMLKEFIGFWGASVLAALPVGMTFSVLMSVIIKPRLAIFWAKA